MFRDARGNGRVAAAEPPRAAYGPRTAEEVEERRPHVKYKVTLPPRGNFFDRRPARWTWESWAKRVEQEGLMMARGMEAVIWGAVGGLLGLACATAPGAVLDGYSYLLWQPMGAAVGAAVGVSLVWRRWRETFRSHQDVSR